MAFLLGAVGPGSADVLGGFKQLRRNDLQMGQLLGTAFSAPQNARICQIADNTSDAGVVPHLAAPGPVAQLV